MEKLMLGKRELPTSTLATLSCGLAVVVLLVDAWRKWGVEVLWWVVVYGISAQGVGGGGTWGV